MSIRNQNWYNLQSTRSYPLDESCSGLDNAAAAIRDDILVDCHIRYPAGLGEYVYVQGITVSAGIVTVLFGVSEGLTLPGPALAAVSLPKPVMDSVNYAITPLQAGVSGWVVFGPGIDTEFTGRYSVPSQTLISPRCGRSYRPLPIPNVSKTGLGTVLDGIVKIIGTSPIKVRYAPDAGTAVNSSGGTVATNVPALVFELDSSLTTTDYNPLSAFLGPCGQRPESGTCPKTPIESVNGIEPDCNGNIDFVFVNMAGHNFAGCGGIDVLADISLPDACAAAKTTLASFYTDQCCAAAFSVADYAALANIPSTQLKAGIIVTTDDTGNRWVLEADLVSWSPAATAEYCAWPDPTALIPDIIQQELPPQPTYPCVSLPVCSDFNACGETVPQFEVKSGLFTVVEADAPPICSASPVDPANPMNFGDELSLHNTYTAYDSTNQNIALFKNCASDWAIGKTIVVELNIGTSGLERNGGLLLNYLKYVTNNGVSDVIRNTFVAAVLDVSRGQLRILRYTDGAATVESHVTMRVKTNAWYRVSATPQRNGNNITIHVIAEELTANSPASASITVQLAATAYGDLLGQAGLFSNRSYACFNKFAIMTA